MSHSSGLFVALALLASTNGFVLPTTGRAASFPTPATTAAAERSTPPIAMARTPKSARGSSTDAPSGKIDGLTALAPFKVYAVLAALIWAIVGSIAN